MRAFFAEGVEKMHIHWAVEGLPTLLHLSLFLFFGGLVIFLFHVDHEVGRIARTTHRFPHQSGSCMPAFII